MIENYRTEGGTLQYFASKEAVLFVKTSQGEFKLARISWGSDGSIYVQFPYLAGKQGLLSEIDVDPNATGPTTYSLAEAGIYARTDVKFSHHASGVVGFSKTGHDERLPRRTSFRLDGPIGRVFELHVQWPTGFAPLGQPKKKPIYLGFNFPSTHPDAVVIAAQWRRKADITRNIDPRGGISGPSTEVIARATGLRSSVYFFGQPSGFPLRDHVLQITSGSVALPRGADRPGMIFLGGWDMHERKDGEASKSLGSCLAFLYPVEIP